MKSAKLLAAAFATGLALITAAVTVPDAASAAPHTHQVPKPKTFTLSNKDNRTALTVLKGDTVTVRLTGQQNGDSTWAWSGPTAADNAVLRRDAQSTAPNGDAMATFHPRASGTTTLDSQLRCVPRRADHSCSHAVVPWQVTVRVK